MSGDRRLEARVLSAEATAARNLPPADYDRTVRAAIDEIASAVQGSERIGASLALAAASLAHSGPLLMESRARIAEHLLTLLPAVSDPIPMAHMLGLLLLAWQQLVATVEAGGESISTMPDLPDGVMLPSGADPCAIADPALRARAFELVQRHCEAVERWNAKQSALEHLHRIAQMVVATRAADDTRFQRLITEMSQTPGVPPDLGRMLEAWPPTGGSGPG